MKDYLKMMLFFWLRERGGGLRTDYVAGWSPLGIIILIGEEDGICVRDFVIEGDVGAGIDITLQTSQK